MPEQIPQTFEEAFKRVQQLTADFKANERRYLSSDYQEAEVRKDFVDKFWMALGWDVNHDFQTNPYEQEVKVERGVSMVAGQRRADYAFYLKPNFREADVRFYVEAKKPSVELASKEVYFQVIRYGWSSNTPLAVVHDFEQFHVLDCRYKPDVETALNRAVATYHFSDYANPEKFKQIYWLFSREAVASGSLEKRAAELPKPRGKAVQRGLFPGAYKPVDESFLEELDEHRTDLARAFKSKNPRLDSESLTELAQRTLDRLVFLRFLEDKGIEAQRLVDKFGDKGSVWEDFVAASRRLDGIYNGIVFKEHAILDKPGFRVDEDIFSGICERLASVNSPFDFNFIPIHILGSIYERFLGKVIVATDKRVRVEEKPEVRKAGGVYYTPEYIVRYIVENTVGKLIAGKKPEQIAEMRFADIACGSGSFLLGVFDLLLQHHGSYYNNLSDTERARAVKRGDCVERDGDLYLSLRKKREILVNNIYGVDIDTQAVEVCQLSLYLKLLKDETTASAHQYLMDFEHVAQMKKLLPDLSKNIVCGNSLIGRDISEGQLFAGDEERKLNPMNFEDAFPHIFAPKNALGVVREADAAYTVGRSFLREGGRRDHPGIKDETCGFDAIVGNPPYVRMELFKAIKDYLREHYGSHDERTDLYVYFLERSIRLLRKGGLYGVIVSNKWMKSKYGERLRGVVVENATVEKIIDFGELPVFQGAATFPAVLIARKGKPEGDYSFSFTHPFERELFRRVDSSELTLVEAEKAKAVQIPSKNLSSTEWRLGACDVEELLTKLRMGRRNLWEYTEGKIRYGIKTGLVEAFVIDEETRKRLIKQSPDAVRLIKPYVIGDDVRNYHIRKRERYLIYTSHGVDMHGCASVLRYLEPFKSRLQKRATKQEWYELQQPQERYAPDYESQKIIYPDIAKESRFALDTSGIYPADTTFVIPIADLYLLGVLNSRVAFFFLSMVCPVLGDARQGGRLRLKLNYVQQLPIPSVDQTRHDSMVKSVEVMLSAKATLAEAQTDKDRNYYEAKCAALDRQIDALVYQLYGLTEEEIKIVEGAVA